MWDLNFHYNYNLINLFLYKFVWLKSSYVLYPLKGVILHFVLRNLTSLDEVRIYNYFYLFRFFFGRKAFISRYSSFFSLGKTYFNFNVQVNCFRRFIYPAIHFFVNDIQSLASLSLVQDAYFRTPVRFSVLFWDVSIFSDKKTNVGLFALSEPLNLKFFFVGTWFNKQQIDFLLTGLKLMK